jgi:hypothetical protein
MAEDFYEDDEPVEDVIAAFGAGPHGVTARPTHTPTMRIAVDFTRVREDGTMSLSIERLRDELGSLPTRNDMVELYEGGELSCWAVVVEVRDFTVLVRRISRAQKWVHDFGVVLSADCIVGTPTFAGQPMRRVS